MRPLVKQSMPGVGLLPHIRLAPAMQSLYSSTVPFEEQRVHAVAIYCSDGRYGDPVDEFLHHHLGLPNYDRMTIPGGPAWLGFRGAASLSQYGLVRDQIDFLVQVHRLRRAVLIAHYGCAYYARHYVGDADALLPTQLQDLRDAANTLKTWYPSLKVEAYVARAAQGRVHFAALPER